MDTPLDPQQHPESDMTQRRVWRKGERHALAPELAAALRRARKARFRTVGAAARAAGMSRSHLSRMENGTRCPSTVIAWALIDRLGLEPGLALELLAVARPDAGRSHPSRRRTNP
jgi:transcriptional regulator with XRE-family HTH domain